GHGLLGGLVERFARGVGVGLDPLELVGEELAGKCPLVRRRHRTPARLVVPGVGSGERFADGPMQPEDQLLLGLIDPPPSSGGPTRCPVAVDRGHWTATTSWDRTVASTTSAR